MTKEELMTKIKKDLTDLNFSKEHQEMVIIMLEVLYIAGFADAMKLATIKTRKN